MEGVHKYIIEEAFIDGNHCCCFSDAQPQLCVCPDSARQSSANEKV
jgi:hypothetical protein